MDLFRVRLNCLDHYQGTPSALDPQIFGKHDIKQERQVPSIPIIRAFGSTPGGQKVCAHVHGAFPYLYVEYVENLESHEGQAKSSRDFSVTN